MRAHRLAEIIYRGLKQITTLLEKELQTTQPEAPWQPQRQQKPTSAETTA